MNFRITMIFFGILLTTLRSHDEIRSSAGIFDRDLPKPDQRMLEIAEKIIEQQEADFDPTEFKDRYEDALRELIERKKKGEPVVSAPLEQEEEKVVDLMDALRRSLKGDGGSREKAERFLAAHEKKGKRKSSTRKTVSGSRSRKKFWPQPRKKSRAILWQIGTWRLFSENSIGIRGFSAS